MNLQTFISKCSQAKMKIAKRLTFDGVYAIIADGYTEGNSEVPQPHYRTAYALGSDSNNLKIMQSIYHEFGKDLGLSSKKEERVYDAINQAKDAARILKNGGIFKSH